MTPTPTPTRTLVAALQHVARTPLGSVSVDQAANIARRILSRQGAGEDAVEVARFGSSV